MKIRGIGSLNPSIRHFFVGFLAIVGIWTVAYAYPPPGTDPSSPTAQWFQGLTVPDNAETRNDGSANGGCCSLADCRPVDYRQTPAGYEVLLDKRFPGIDEPVWVPVPDSVILHNKPNPLGQPVACYYNHKIRCFVAPPET